jgi:hypothetical protein
MEAIKTIRNVQTV